MRRITALVMATLLAFSIATGLTAKAEDMAADTLVVYFSATGTTRQLAEVAADILKADIAEIVPEFPYTAEDLAYYTDCRADREQQDDTARPAISGSSTGRCCWGIRYGMGRLRGSSAPSWKATTFRAKHWCRSARPRAVGSDPVPPIFTPLRRMPRGLRAGALPRELQGKN